MYLHNHITNSIFYGQTWISVKENESINGNRAMYSVPVTSQLIGSHFIFVFKLN